MSERVRGKAQHRTHDTDRVMLPRPQCSSLKLNRRDNSRRGETERGQKVGRGGEGKKASGKGGKKGGEGTRNRQKRRCEWKHATADKGLPLYFDLRED